MRRGRERMDRAGAERIGLEALVFMTGDAARLSRFLALSGMTPDELRAGAGEPSLHAALLEHLRQDESLLLVFAASAQVRPEDVEPALRLLAGAGD